MQRAEKIPSGRLRIYGELERSNQQRPVCDASHRPIFTSFAGMISFIGCGRKRCPKASIGQRFVTELPQSFRLSAQRRIQQQHRVPCPFDALNLGTGKPSILQGDAANCRWSAESTLPCHCCLRAISNHDDALQIGSAACNQGSNRRHNQRNIVRRQS